MTFNPTAHPSNDNFEIIFVLSRVSIWEGDEGKMKNEKLTTNL
jgi:hypothetical protein